MLKIKINSLTEVIESGFGNLNALNLNYLIFSQSLN